MAGNSVGGQWIKLEGEKSVGIDESCPLPDSRALGAGESPGRHTKELGVIMGLLWRNLLYIVLSCLAPYLLYVLFFFIRVFSPVACESGMSINRCYGEYLLSCTAVMHPRGNVGTELEALDLRLP
jgi:hypothetical protein